MDQREVSARECGGPWAGGALGSRSGWIAGASQERWPHCQGPHLAEHASTSRTPGHDTQPKARRAPSLTAKPKDTGDGHTGVASTGREPQGLGQAPPTPGKLAAIREGWAGSRAGGCKGASEKQGGHRRAGSEAESTIRRWPGRRAEDEDLDQRQPASHTLTGRETEQALNLLHLLLCERHDDRTCAPPPTPLPLGCCPQRSRYRFRPLGTSGGIAVCPLWWDALGVPCVLLKSPKCQSHAYPHDQGWHMGTPTPPAQCISSLPFRWRGTAQQQPRPTARRGSWEWRYWSGGHWRGSGAEQKALFRPFMEKEGGALQGDGGEWAETINSAGYSQRPHWARGRMDPGPPGPVSRSQGFRLQVSHPPVGLAHPCSSHTGRRPTHRAGHEGLASRPDLEHGGESAGGRGLTNALAGW